jgi:putative transposon-encoded protein
VKEGYYALGGAVAGVVTGFLLGKSAKISVPSDIQKQAEKITASTGGTVMTMKALTRYTVGESPAVLYAFYSGNDINAVMSVYIGGGSVWYEFGQCAGDDVTIYYKGALTQTLSGNSKYFVKPV